MYEGVGFIHLRLDSEQCMNFGEMAIKLRIPYKPNISLLPKPLLILPYG
jgi:hypothetical protein